MKDWLDQYGLTWTWDFSHKRHDIRVGVWLRSWSLGILVDTEELYIGLGPFGLHWSWG